MPWSKSDARKFTRKARSAPAQRQWKEVANRALKSGASEGSAIRQANAVVSKRRQK